MALTYTLIGSSTVSSNVTSVTFSSIPQTYSDLVLKVSARTSTNNRNFGLRFNNNAGNIYSDWILYGTGSGTGATSQNSVTNTNYTYQNISTDPTNSYSNNEFYIPHYTNTVSTKTFIGDSAVGTTATAGWLSHTAQSMANTSAITQIDVRADGNFTSGTTLYLYGILRA